MGNITLDTAEFGLTVRRLMRRLTRVSLATVEAEGGAPYASLAMVALDHDAAPLLLLSDLADHTRNLKADPRASLLFDGTADRAVPLAGERASVQGRVERVHDEPRLLARYVARHPDAAAYASFGDFNLYRMTVERAHLVAGFGRIRWVPAELVLHDASGADLAAAEAGIVAHMNDHDGDAIRLYVERLLALGDGGGWRMTGVDPEGADLRREPGGEVARLPFDKPVRDAEGARAELVRLVERARQQQAQGTA
jgi:putative heme iron utilization protein